MRHALHVLAILLLGTATVLAAAPSLITVQGKLTDAGGSPLPIGSKDFEFRIFNDSTGGSQVWPAAGGENQSIMTGAEGLWIALVGSVDPLTANVFSDSLRWLEITVDGTTLPRTQLVTGPYAFRVATVDGASGGTISSKVSIGPGHANTGTEAFVAGEGHVAMGAWSTIAGGMHDTATETFSTVGGGNWNAAKGYGATVGGGISNRASAPSSYVGGGGSNRASGPASTIGGGEDNAASGHSSVIAGGESNVVSMIHAAVLGGGSNSATASASTVGGGVGNMASGDSSIVGGGTHNAATNVEAVVVGGTDNLASGAWSAILGGSGNVAAAQGASVGGGFNNMSSGFYSVVGGGGGPTLADSNSASVLQATVGGGRRNTASGSQTTVAGGDGNRALSQGASVGGGFENIASGLNSAIAGGASDTANGSHSMIPGGLGNRASGLYSFAAGRRAKAQHDGAFVWADDQNSDFPTNNSRQFLIRAANGVGINTNAPEKALHVLGSAKIRDTLFASFVSSNSPLSLQTSGTTRMYIDETSGNVGINSGIPPTSRLQVGGVIHSALGGIKFPDGRTQAIGGLIAYGHIGQDGTIQASSGNISSSFDAVNTRYLITITGETYAPLSYVTIATCNGLAATFIPGISGVGGQLVVTMFDTAGGKVQSPFQFVTYKP